MKKEASNAPSALPDIAHGGLLQLAASHDACEARTAAGLIALNRETAEYGLLLSPDEARALAETRTFELHDVGRVEFGESAVVPLARGFASSPYVTRNNWYETLEELTGIFYRLKSATFDRIGDAELIGIMRDAFDSRAHGSTELLEGRELDILARRVRAGYTAGTDEPVDTLPDDDYDEGEDDGFTAEKIIM